VFRQPPPDALANLDVLYAVGGLYGHEAALHAVLRLFEAERGRKALVFNGDFHWFDADPATFDRIQQAVLAHTALRGNVETELANPHPASDAGCGCAYPDWVGDGVVERSNRILQRLWTAATDAHRRQLAALPMALTAQVGGLRVGVVHGDAESLAGWGFAQEHLRQPEHRVRVRAGLDAAGVDAFVSSHTCLPVFQRLGGQGGHRWVFNNGAAGMPNFRGDPAGLFTRLATTPFDGPQRRGGVRHGPLWADAIALPTDPVADRAAFLRLWPPGSDAHTSYFDRIAHGPDYTPDQLIRLED
jgi:predicted phosphodiesterase